MCRAVATQESMGIRVAGSVANRRLVALTRSASADAILLDRCRSSAGTLPADRPPCARLLHGPVGQQISTSRNLDRCLHAPDKRDGVEYRVDRAPQPSFLPNSGALRSQRDRRADKRNGPSDSSRHSGAAPTGNCPSDAHERSSSKSCALRTVAARTWAGRPRCRETGTACQNDSTVPISALAVSVVIAGVPRSDKRVWRAGAVPAALHCCAARLVVY
jgi:hypothetical protein